MRQTEQDITRSKRRTRSSKAEQRYVGERKRKDMKQDLPKREREGEREQTKEEALRSGNGQWGL